MPGRKKLFKSLLLHKKQNNPNVSNSYIRNVSKIQKQNFYICSFSSFLLDNSQFESCRKVITRIIRRQRPRRLGEFFPCLKINLPYTQKAKNSRMGKGKGSFIKFVYRINSFSPLFFLRKVTIACAARAMHQIQYKLPIKLCLLTITKVIKGKESSYINTSHVCVSCTEVGAVRLLQ